jgi:hypothetical protein
MTFVPHADSEPTEMLAAELDGLMDEQAYGSLIK